MARRVFLCFHYENDNTRSLILRNSQATQGKEAEEVIDKAELEQHERRGIDAFN